MIDLHIHSTFSDGWYSPKQIVVSAMSKGVKIIAMTDHFRTRKTRSLPEEAALDYIRTLRGLQELHGEKIRILIGLEIDLLDLALTGRDLPEPDILRQLDIVLFEAVANRSLEGVPYAFARDLRKRVPVPVALAHTDIERAFPGESPRSVIQKLARDDFFIELNESYMRPGDEVPFYEHLTGYFEAARDSGVKFTTGSDMHTDLNLLGASRAFQFLIERDFREELYLFGELQKM